MNGNLWPSNAMPVFYCNNHIIIDTIILFATMMVGLCKHYLILAGIPAEGEIISVSDLYDI